MAQGTITLSNGSKNVTGSGTNFSTFAPGSFISVTLTGVVYTIAIDSIGSDTNLTLSVPFDGPTVSGVAFVYSDVGSMALATMGVTVQAQKALRMMIADATNWRNVFSDQQTITITLPDGTQYSGYSWGYISQLLKEINVPNLEAIRDEATAAAAAAKTSEDNAYNYNQYAGQNATNAANSASASEASRQASAASASASATSATNAHNSEVASANSAAASAQSANNAQQWAAAVNPDTILYKADNLSGLTNRSTARTNLGLGAGDGVQFANVSSQVASDAASANGGPFSSVLKGTNGTARVTSSVYSEVRADTKAYATIALTSGTTTRYLGYNADGDLSGVVSATLSGSLTASSLTASSGNVEAKQGQKITVSTQSGGDKSISLQNVASDGATNGWVNLLQGNWYNGYWQIGAIRGAGTDIDMVQLGVNSQGNAWRSFQFRPQSGGYLYAPRGFRGASIAGSWTDSWNAMGSIFWADRTVSNNDNGHVSIVSGGSKSAGGYATQVGLGIISGGTAAWPSATITMIGDGTYIRGYTFSMDGNINSFDSPSGTFGGSFIFSRAATSDRNLKHDIVYTEGKESFDRVMQWLPTMFKYNGQETQRYGLIAQDLRDIDEQYVKEVKGGPITEIVEEIDEETGELVKRAKETGEYAESTLALDNNVIMTDMACALRYLGGVVQDLQSKLAEQTSK